MSESSRGTRKPGRKSFRSVEIRERCSSCPTAAPSLKNIFCRTVRESHVSNESLSDFFAPKVTFGATHIAAIVAEAGVTSACSRTTISKCFCQHCARYDRCRRGYEALGRSPADVFDRSSQILLRLRPASPVHRFHG